MRQLMENVAAIPTGIDAGDDDPWPGWPSTTPPRDGGDADRKRILIPYNRTRTADGSLDVAAQWCQLLGAEAWVLYVRPWDPVRGGRIYIETPSEARDVAHAGAGQLRARGIAASALVRNSGRRGIADIIVAEALTLDATSIVMGTPARRALSTALMGSTSMTVARRSPRPVILVKAVAHRIVV
jgi:nucleotide-binding universal stress UspA family protein